MPRTGLSPAEVREKAIEATLAKMRKVGFEKVRLSDIAKEMGLSHAALYSHFKDKSDLLDAVSERWLLNLDKILEDICEKNKDPCEKIRDWALIIYRSKVEKVRHDPEMYRAFDMATEQLKPFVKTHIENMHRQLLGLVTEAIAKKGLRKADPEHMARVVASSLEGFHHPRLVAQHIEEKREKLIHAVIDSVLTGLRLS